MSAGIPDPVLTLFTAARGRSAPSLLGGSLGVGRLDSDPVGTFTLRLKNLAAGSRVRVESQAAGTTLDGFVAAGGDQDRTLNLYASGNTLNDLRIKVRKATASPKYKPFETLASAQAGIVTAYIAQVSDE